MVSSRSDYVLMGTKFPFMLFGMRIIYIDDLFMAAGSR